MNGAAAKATKRDLRRAFGSEAVDAMQDHENRIGEQAMAINALNLALSARYVALEHRVAALERRTLHARWQSMTAKVKR